MPRAKREGSAPSSSKSAPGQGNVEEIRRISPDPDLNEEIRRRAYQIYEERGGQGGTADEDWLRAESEVRGRYRQRPA